MKNVLLFADPGIDDSLALIYAILNPEINLVGVVACYGNVHKEQAVQNVRYLLELGNMTNVPVIRGAEGPVSGEYTAFYPEIHGPEGLGPIRPPQYIQTNFNSYNDIFRIVNELSEDLIVVNIGRNSSLSIALGLEAEIMAKVSSYHFMGGAFLVPGNVTPVAEANVHGDPIAARNVFSKAKNSTLFPLNVTNSAFITNETAAQIKTYAQNPYKDLVPSIINYYLNAYKKMYPGIPGAPLHDVLTLIALDNPSVCNYLNRTVDVQVEGPAKGLTISDFRNRPEKQQNDNQIKIAVELNYKLFYQDFLKIMTRPLI